MTNDQKPVISVRKLRKVYMMGQEHVVALHNIDLDIPRGEVCCIFGTSGSGKSPRAAWCASAACRSRA